MTIKIKDTLVVIPARGGSKRVPGKNIRTLSGKPLVSHTIDYALKFFGKSDIVISTDNVALQLIGKKYGINIHNRNLALSGDNSLIDETMLNILLEFNDDRFKYLLLLEPTSPFRKEEHLNAARTAIMEQSKDLVFYIKNIYENIGRLSPQKTFSPLESARRSQDRTAVYAETGILYYIDKINLEKTKKIYTDNHVALIENDESNLDINTEIDFSIASIISDKNAKDVND